MRNFLRYILAQINSVNEYTMNKIHDYVLERLNTLSCEEVAKKIGMDVRNHRALCFMHDDHHPSLHFSGRNRERWWCFVCNNGGSAINLVMEYFGLRFVEACQWLGDQFGINVGMDRGGVIHKKKIPLIKKKRIPTYESPPFSKEVAQWILENNSLTEIGRQFLYWQRNLKRDIIGRLNIISIDEPWRLIENLRKAFDTNTLQESGFVTTTSSKMYFRMFTPCLLFPYYAKDGSLVGIQSRYLGNNEEAPRFQFVSAQKTRLYNMPVLNTMINGEDLYISEGITDCLALLSSRKKAVAIPSATILPKSDLLDLAKFKLHMYPDQDDAGKRAYANLRRFFINHYATLKEEQLPAGIKDYCEYYVNYHGTGE